MFSDCSSPRSKGGDSRYERSMVTSASPARNQTPCQNTRPMAPKSVPRSQASPLRRPMMIWTPMEKPKPSMYRIVK